MEGKTCLIFCRCGAGIFSGLESDKLAAVLKNLQADVYELHDLCALSLNEKELLTTLGRKYDHKIVIACYPRAIENLFSQNEIDFGVYTVINFRELMAQEVAVLLKSRFLLKEGVASSQVVVSQLKVPAWYPLIDKSRCTYCGQCSHFCLFGVYQSGRKRLAVVNPLACKNNCPACSRICPESAIIFPRLPENSVLSGADPGEIHSQDVHPGNGQLLNRLNERNRKRNSIFVPDLIAKAEEERKSALEEIADRDN